MRLWPWARRRREPEPGKREPEHGDDDRAQRALTDSTRKLEIAKAQETRVNRTVSKLEQLRQRNNFAAMLDAALREHR